MYVVFDIGGTKSRFGISKDGKTLVGEPVVFSTHREWSAAEEKMRGEIQNLGEKITAVCGGLPGVFDSKKEILSRSPNLPDWVGKPIKKFFESVTGATDVRLLNDTIAVGMGEAIEGAGKGYSIVAYMTVSTGVGGARFIHGVPDKSHSGLEPGHQIIDASRRLSLENLVSGAAFERRFGRDFVKTATQDAWEEAAFMLAVGIHNVIVHWSPDIVVLGGSMTLKTPGISIASVRKQLLEIVKIFPEVPKLESAILGEKAGLLGALAALRQNVS